MLSYAKFDGLTVSSFLGPSCVKRVCKLIVLNFQIFDTEVCEISMKTGQIYHRVPVCVHTFCSNLSLRKKVFL